MTVPATPADIIGRYAETLRSDDRQSHGRSVLAALTEAGYTIVRTDDLGPDWVRARARLREALG